jgi:predicted nucleic acid-binding protein
MPSRFLDTNLLIRYLTRDDEQKARRALVLLQRLERGDERVRSTVVVIFETVFTLQRYYKVAKPRIRELMRPLIALRGLHLPNKGLLVRALDVYVEHNISFADAYHAADMASRGEVEIYSWDTDFDRIPGVTRVEPLDDAAA